MNSPAVTPFAPSTQPALELIALAQLSPEVARQKLRALLLGNPNHFGKVPPTTFNAVLKIQEDTTYECISQVGYNPEFEELCAKVDIKKLFGYSSDVLINGSEEFVRFYLSYDGGAKWLDQGMRSVNVIDAHMPRPLSYEVTLPLIAARGHDAANSRLKVRAILSWNSPPPVGAPNWTPVWGNILDSDIRIEDSPTILSSTLHSGGNAESPNTAMQAMNLQTPICSVEPKRQGHNQFLIGSSTASDPQHRFLAYVLAKAANYDSSGFQYAETSVIDPFHRTVSRPAIPVAASAEPVLAPVS
ncbi:MAG: hypothetical protein WB561_12730 [Terracidiphilus sp.]